MQTGFSKFILAYDADCGPCTRFRYIVDILDKYEKIDFNSLTKAYQEGLLDKIPIHQRYKSFHLIFSKGETKSGSEALLELIAILPGGNIISPIINNFPGGKEAVRPSVDPRNIFGHFRKHHPASPRSYLIQNHTKMLGYASSSVGIPVASIRRTGDSLENVKF
jgi:predicted DCC family thiol-disulfide oxidoreductase YuxK